MYPAKDLPYLSRSPLSVMEQLCLQLEDNLLLIDAGLPRRSFFRMDEVELRKHLFYLTLGVESQLFTYKDDRFQMIGSPVVEGLSPDLLSQLVRPFFECGRLVRRINLTEWNPKCGMVHSALVDELRTSLQFHQQLMEELMGTRSLLAVGEQVKLMLPTLRLMEGLWSWPDWRQRVSGRGMGFLQHLVHFATGTIDDQERRLLTAYFAACVRPFLT